MIDIDQIISDLNLGKKEAFIEIIDEYQTKIRGFCRNMTSNPEIAEDLAQEVFIKVYQKIHTFRGDSNFNTWIFKVARNHTLDYLRKNKIKTSSFDELSEKERESLLEISKESDLERNLDNQKIINKLISSLSDNYRDVLILREIQGFSYEEIANILNCSLDAVKARLKRARAESMKTIRHFLEVNNVYLTKDDSNE